MRCALLIAAALAAYLTWRKYEMRLLGFIDRLRGLR